MNINAVRSKLTAWRAELLGDLAVIEHDLDMPMPQDWEDRASERQGDEVLEALGAHDLEELRMIDAALARITAGTYGKCVRCGAQISPARLRALPETPLCQDCVRGHVHA